MRSFHIGMMVWCLLGFIFGTCYIANVLVGNQPIEPVWFWLNMVCVPLNAGLAYHNYREAFHA